MINLYDKNYKIIKGKLLCPLCFVELDKEKIFDNAWHYWPDSGWIYSKCNNCKKNFHIEMEEENGGITGVIKIGDLSGAPGPLFLCCSEMLFDDVLVYKTADSITIKFEDRNKVYKILAEK